MFHVQAGKKDVSSHAIDGMREHVRSTAAFFRQDILPCHRLLFLLHIFGMLPLFPCRKKSSRCRCCHAYLQGDTTRWRMINAVPVQFQLRLVLANVATDLQRNRDKLSPQLPQLPQVPSNGGWETPTVKTLVFRLPASLTSKTAALATPWKNMTQVALTVNFLQDFKKNWKTLQNL